MAISEACKYEIEESVDTACEKEGISKNEAFRSLQEMYESIGIMITFSAVKGKYHRAKKEKVTNVTFEEKGGDTETKQEDTKMEDTKSVTNQKKPYLKNTVYLEKMEQLIETGQAKIQIEAIRVIAKETGEKTANIYAKINRAKKKRLKRPLVQETERPTKDELGSFAIQNSYQARVYIDRIVAYIDDPFKEKALLGVFECSLAAIMREIEKGGKKWLQKNVDASMRQRIMTCLKALSHIGYTQKRT